MKTEISNIIADDGSVEAKIRVELQCGNDLTQDELYCVSRDISDNIGDALRHVRYTDFGPRNTVVKL